MNPSIYDKPVVIVGAGVTGLVSAHLLAEAGVKVIVVECLEDTGGLARSYIYDGNGEKILSPNYMDQTSEKRREAFTFDCGPHRFDVNNPNIRSYVTRILKDRITDFPRKSEVYFKQKYYDWPIKPQNLVQLPKEIAVKAFVDLTINGFRNYEEDHFENYILRQYGPTLYQHFFADYSYKFLGITPNETHSDWAKVGINRAIIDDNAQMQNLFQLLKSTLLQFNKKPQRFYYPTTGMHEAWTIVSQKIHELGGEIYLNQKGILHGDDIVIQDRNGRHTKRHIAQVQIGDLQIEPSQVIWTGPITQAGKQLGSPTTQLQYLGLLLFNVMVKEEAPRDYQWCYYGSTDLVFNRISTPRFLSPATCPSGTTGYCCEVTCMEGDERWIHGERLTDWVIDDLIKVGMIKNRNNVLDVQIERLPHSYPIYHVNYPQELQNIRNDISRYQNLQLAGRTGLFWYNNMDHSMENAIQLVKQMLKSSGKNNITEKKLASGI